MRSLKIIFIAIALSFLASCSPLVRAEQPIRNKSIELDENTSLGQTFVSRFDGLNTLYIHINNFEKGNGNLVLELNTSTASENYIAVSKQSLDKFKTPNYYGFSFSPIKNSTQKDYYFQIRMEGEGIVKIAIGDGNSYINGSIYQNNKPDNGQLSFKLGYSNYYLFLGLIEEFISWLRILLVALFIFFIPGYAILLYIFPRLHAVNNGGKHFSNMAMRNWVEILALSVGISLALYPIIYLWVNFFGLSIGSQMAWGIPITGVIIILWQLKNKIRNIFINFSLSRLLPIQINCAELSLLIILLIIFAVRFWVIRSLEAPMWGDSVQHATVTQLILDNFGIFKSWQPYAPYETFSTHFGFSLFVALFSWVNGMDVLSSSLVTGQLISFFSILTLYPLARKLTGLHHLTGIGAFIIAGLVSPTPAIYTNWGRYAQLAGQVILPVAIYFIWEILENKGNQAKRIILSGILLTGLALCYYRMPFFYLSFLLILFIFKGINDWQRDYQKWRNPIMILIVIGVSSLILFFPWINRILFGELASFVEHGISRGSTIDQVILDFNAWKNITNFVPPLLLIIVLLTFIYSILTKKWLIASLPIWIVLLTAYIAGGLIRLPGANMLQNFTILIALYIPISLMGDWLFVKLVEWVPKITTTINKGLKKYSNNQSNLNPNIIQISIVIMVIGSGFWAGWKQRYLIDPANHAMVNRPDMKAMEWIVENTPPDSIFLVQGFSIYNGISAVGSDAGWWLPLLTKRSNTMPPQYALFNETPAEKGYSKRVVSLINELETNPIYSQESIRLLCDWGITHIYNGQGQGKVGSRARQLFNPNDFSRNTTTFQLTYREDRVSIYKLFNQACEEDSD